MFFSASGDRQQPLVVSLHTWSWDYRQKDPLAPMIFEKGWNYIRPDFRGANICPEACGSEKVIPDIEDAVRYATLLMYMKTTLDIRSFSAWVPISDLVDWYWACESRGLKYAGDILSFCNKLVNDMKGKQAALVSQEDAMLMLSQRTFNPAGEAQMILPEGRRIHYRKQFHSINLTIFEGGHELLTGAAMEELKNH